MNSSLQALASPDFAGTRLSDGRRACCYADLAGAFERVAEMLAGAGAIGGDCAVVECDNRLDDVLVLLGLLNCGRHFVLSPAVDSPPVPDFCRYRVTVAENDVENVGLLDGVRVAENPSWNGARLPDSTPLLYLLTSGSTGEPRAAVHEHTTLLRNAQGCVERFQITSADRVSVPVPIHHMYGLGAALLPALLAGAAINLLAGANVLMYLARERSFDPNVAFLVPGLCAALNVARRKKRPGRLTVTAGDRMLEDDVRRYEELHGIIVNLYGSTELGAIAAGSPSDSAAMRARTVGRPMPGVELAVGPADVAPTDSEPRELWFRHASGFLGYADEHGVPVAPVTENGAYRTHDLGRVGADGAIEVLGRTDHRVKRDGRMVAFATVEEVLSGLDGVLRAVVITSGFGSRGAQLIACCVPRPGADLDEAALRSSSLAGLPRYAVPDHFLIVDDLPLLRSGKVDRPELVRRYERGASDSSR